MAEEKKFNYYLLIFVLLCIVIGLGGTAFLAQTGRGIGGVAFLIGSILVFVFFGLRWFEYGIGNKFASSTWPPVINTCPDYLVFTKRIKNSKEIGTCIDPLGISRGNMRLWVFGNNPPTSTGSGSNAPSDDYYFDLDFDEIDPIKLATLRCDRVKNKGVTWDGVGDGDTCYKQNALSAAANTAAAQCASASAAI